VSDFEFVFSLFGLMLGFSLAEVLGGLIRTVKARRHVRLGWLTPMLAVFVMLDVTSFWANAWSNREAIPATYGFLVLGLVATGLYYFSASLLFPERPEECADLDDHFYQRRRQILAGVAICNLMVIAGMLAVRSPEVTQVAALITHGIYFSMIALAALPRQRPLNIAALAVLILLYLLFAAVTLYLGPPPAVAA
jgi:hypothetical protein